MNPRHNSNQRPSPGLPRVKEALLPRFGLLIRSLVCGFHLLSSSSSSLLFIPLLFASPSICFSRDKYVPDEHGASGTNQSIDLSTHPLKCPLWSSAENKVFIKRNLSSPSSSLCFSVPSLANGEAVHTAQVLLPITMLWSRHTCLGSLFLHFFTFFLKLPPYSANLNPVISPKKSKEPAFLKNDPLWKYWSYKKRSDV